MNFMNLTIVNLVSPAVMFFLLGIAAGAIKSDLEIPKSISRYLSIYLMMSIGFKGGVALNTHGDFSLTILALILAGVSFSFLQPFVGFYCLRVTSKLDSATAAALSAHYGSTSMVTFATACAFLKSKSIPYEGVVVAILALMEAPAILSGLFLAHKFSPETDHHAQEEKKLSREIFTNGAILLLLGSLLIGALTGQTGMDSLHGFLVDPFQGILCLFLLDMGIMVSQNLAQLKKIDWPIISFGFYMPAIGATFAIILSSILNVDIGTALLFTILCASASYIAVPAAMRLALPEANPAVYMPMALAITFPLNIIIGIPTYYSILCLLNH